MGQTYTAVIGAGKLDRTVDKVKAFAALGKAAFLKACDVALKAIEQVPAAEQEGLIIVDPVRRQP